MCTCFYCLPACMYVFLSAFVSVCLSLCLSFCIAVFFLCPFCLIVCVSAYRLPAFACVCPFVYLPGWFPAHLYACSLPIGAYLSYWYCGALATSPCPIHAFMVCMAWRPVVAFLASSPLPCGWGLWQRWLCSRVGRGPAQVISGLGATVVCTVRKGAWSVR